MYSVRLEWPTDRTKRSRPSHVGSVGSWRSRRWNVIHAAGARLIAVPGWPEPASSTASIARARMVSLARRSRSRQPVGAAVALLCSDVAVLTGAFSSVVVRVRAVLGGAGAGGRRARADVSATARARPWRNRRHRVQGRRPPSGAGPRPARSYPRAVPPLRATSVPARDASVPGGASGRWGDDGPGAEASVVDVVAPVLAPPDSGPQPSGGRFDRVRAYVALTKPRVVELLLVVTLPAMVLAADGWPGTLLVATTLVGGALGAGAAGALNCWVERDRDALMRRTSRRPLPTHAVSDRGALVLGAVLQVVSFALLALAVNLLTALLVLAASAFYVLVYTIWLKPRTPQNIVWGGAAGCVPALAGWSAVTGSLDWPAWVLFGVVFFWTPPHFWALALKFRDDYAAAGVPMLPVVASRRVVGRQVVAYTWATVALSLVLALQTSWLYPLVAVAAGAVFLREAHRLNRSLSADDDGRPMRLFHASTTYLTVVSVGVVVDVLLPLPPLLG